MGLIWKRDPLTTLTGGQRFTSAYVDIREEIELHQYLSKLERLRSSAVSEFELRGSFPDAAYRRILQSTGAMLDAFHALNNLITKNPRATKGEADILQHTTKEREYLSKRISHLFQGIS